MQADLRQPVKVETIFLGQAVSIGGTVNSGGGHSHSDYPGLLRHGGGFGRVLRFHDFWIRNSQRLPTDILPQFAAYARPGVLLFNL